MQLDPKAAGQDLRTDRLIFPSGQRIPDKRFRKIVENKCKEEIKWGNVDSENPTKWMKWSGQSRIGIKNCKMSLVSDSKASLQSKM